MWRTRQPVMTLKFGRFEVLPHRRELLAEGVPVPLGSRAFDVLMVLLEAGRGLVTQGRNLSPGWPGAGGGGHNPLVPLPARRQGLGGERGRIQTTSGPGGDCGG